MGYRVDARKRRLELTETSGRTLGVPFGRLDPAPRSAGDIAEVGFDRDLGRHGIVYRLSDGREGALLWEHCLDYNADPAHMEAALLRRLTRAAEQALGESKVAKREIARRLGTSPAQLYRLLDPENDRKSIGQMIALLHVLGRRTELVIEAA